MVIDWDGEFISEKILMNLNPDIQVTTMMISVLNMALEQLLLMDVGRPLWDSFGILAVMQMPTSVR